MTSNPATSDPVHALRAARQKYGLARLHMGVLLEHIRNSKGWEGHAESFTGFLEELRINQSAAYQYMRVARRFFFEMPLPDAALTEMCMANISTLDLASRVANQENLAEVVSIVTALMSVTPRPPWRRCSTQKPRLKRARGASRGLPRCSGCTGSFQTTNASTCAMPCG